jgi:serine/threonine-protein kinase
VPQKNYEVVARLVDRGISEVFVARAAEDGGTRPVLIERLARARATDPDVVRTFLERARIGFQLAHPNIAQVIDVGRLGSTYYLALEHLDGEPLRAVIDHARAREKLQVPVRAALTIAAGIASALRHAHDRQDGDGRGLVHGNLSPANIVINRDGVVKVLDFGLPLDEQVPAYRSPEQVSGDPIDRRSDLFSLGAVLWELLCRDPLFKRDSNVDTLMAVEDDPAPPPSAKRMDVPPELDAIVLKLLAKAPGDRYQDADDVLVDLEALATKLAFQISTTDLSRMLRLWFGTKPVHTTLPTQATVVPDDLAAEALTEEVELDRVLDDVAPPPEHRRSDTTTPPPATVEPPVESKESFEQIRDRILGQRASNDTSGPRAKAYTNPAIPTEGSRTATLPWGMSPTAITDVISRVTQAASAQGAATRAAVAKQTEPLPTEVAKTVPMEHDPVELMIPKQTVPMGSVRTESSEVRRLEAVERRLIETAAEQALETKPTAPMDAKPTESLEGTPTAAMDAKPTESMEPRPVNGTATEAKLTQPVLTRQIEVVEPISEAKPMTVAAVKLDDEQPEAKAESVEHKEQSAKLVLPRTQSTEWFERGEREGEAKSESVEAKDPSSVVALPRTQSTEWFERGEREAKEAHARHAREVAEEREAPRGSTAHAEEPHREGRSRLGLVLAALASIALALVVVAIVKFTGREPPSRTMPVARPGSGSASQVAAEVPPAPIDAAVVAPPIDAAEVAASSIDAAEVAAAPSDAAVVARPIDAARVAAVPVDAAVVPPPIDAAQVAAVPVDAAQVAAVPVDAARPVPVDAAKVATAPRPKKPEHRRPEHTAEPAPEPPPSIEDLYGKGDFAKADKACATNTQFNASILEMCFLSACQVKDTGLANRWIRAIARAQREDLAAKCKDLGVAVAVP